MPTGLEDQIDWSVGSTWLIRFEGYSAPYSVKVLLTDEVVRTCRGGTWRRMQVISREGVFLDSVHDSPAYSVSGSTIRGDMNVNHCVRDGVFEGKSVSGRMLAVYPVYVLSGRPRLTRVIGERL
jgi:hypothetical protein